MPPKIQKPKGTQDITPKDVDAWQWLTQTAQETLEAANYKGFYTPIFEETALFQRGIGEGTDVVNKEMYTFEKGKRSLTLRPEGTASIVRGFVEHGLFREALPQRYYYCGPMFRYERPQEGRQRQFHQIGAELLGLNTAAADAEVILLAWETLQALGIQDVRLELNTVGDPEDRPRFRESLRDLLRPRLGELCEDCQRRFEQNPIRMLDCKVPTCKAIYAEDAVTELLNDFQWSTEAEAAFAQLQTILRANGVPFTVNPRMVRGLDYYARTVFEFVTDRLGAQGTVCGGGRYNGLVEELGGPPTPAVGWAMGLERLSKLMQAPDARPLDAYIVTDQHAEAFKLAQVLRQQGQRVEVDLSSRAFGKQMQTANKRGAQQVYTLGTQELETGLLTRKSFISGEQEQIAFASILVNATI